ncbi:MAG: hypothetical protein VKJ05_07645 [Synechococcaceae cyanobacterium]|nr:hypothetical protein [Synechococcaceae cyanobacterium]
MDDTTGISPPGPIPPEPEPADSLEDLDLAGVLQWVGLGMLLAFLAILLKVLLPPALLRPAWQLAVAEALRGGASVALVGAVLLLLAERLDPEEEDLACLVRGVRRLAILAAIGYFLLIPLQVSAGLRQLGQTSGAEERELRQMQQAVETIERARSPEALRSAIGRLPALPPEIRSRLAASSPALRASVLAQIEPKLRRLDNRLREIRRQRLQEVLLLVGLDGLTALAYGIGFAALGRSRHGGPTLLQQLLLLPQQLAALRESPLPPHESEPLP